MPKPFTQGFAEAVNDIRQKLVEEGWFGKAVTPRSNTITIGSTGEQSPAEKLGWFQRDDSIHQSPSQLHAREVAANVPKTPDRGIDL